MEWMRSVTRLVSKWTEKFPKSKLNIRADSTPLSEPPMCAASGLLNTHRGWCHTQTQKCSYLLNNKAHTFVWYLRSFCFVHCVFYLAIPLSFDKHLHWSVLIFLFLTLCFLYPLGPRKLNTREHTPAPPHTHSSSPHLLCSPITFYLSSKDRGSLLVLPDVAP